MRGIRRQADLDEVARRLAERTHSTTGRTMFATLRDVLCFAAMIGFELEQQTPLTGETVELDGRLFAHHQPSIDTIYLIGLALTRDINILRDEREEELLSIFEEFANGGLRVLSRWLDETPEDEDGDYAIVNALRKRGHLNRPRQVDSAISDVEF